MFRQEEENSSQDIVSPWVKARAFASPLIFTAVVFAIGILIEIPTYHVLLIPWIFACAIGALVGCYSLIRRQAGIKGASNQWFGLGCVFAALLSWYLSGYFILK